MATPLAHSRRGLPDAELARLAGAGDGEAFAELYDRHEQRVYGFCMRLLGAPHDAAEATQETFVRLLGRLPALEGRELNFVAYTLTSARNACYDMIRARRTVEPVAEHPDGPAVGRGDQGAGEVERDPERLALLQSSREEVRAANAALPVRQREVLALREVEQLSYEQIGELMGLNRNAVAQLISRARIKLAELMRGRALASVSAATPECERALPLLAALQDGEDAGRPQDSEEARPLEWVRAHLTACETCRVSRAAMEEAGVSYRALGPIVALAWLRHASIARAAEAVGADWSHLAGDSSGGGAAALAGVRRRWTAGVLLGALLCAILVLVAASDIARDGNAPVRALTLVSPPQTSATAAVAHHGLAKRPHAAVAGRLPHALARHRSGTTTVAANPAPLTPPPPGHRLHRTHAYVVHHHSAPPRHHTPTRHTSAPTTPPTPASTPSAPPATPPATVPTSPAPPTTTTAPPKETTTTTPPPSTTETTKHPEEPGTGRAPGGGGLIP